MNNQRSLHLQYHDCGETLEQAMEPPTAPRAPQQYGCPLLWVCVFSAVCVHLDGLNAEHKFRVCVNILGHTSLHCSDFTVVQTKVNVVEQGCPILGTTLSVKLSSNLCSNTPLCNSYVFY